MFSLSVDSVLKDFRSKVDRLHKISDTHTKLACTLKEDAALFISEANVSIAEAERAKKVAKKLAEFINE